MVTLQWAARLPMPLLMLQAAVQSGITHGLKAALLCQKKDGAGFWGNPESKEEIGSGVKTIYDPCPAGWRVPDPEAFRFITSDGVDLPTAIRPRHVSGR